MKKMFLIGLTGCFAMGAFSAEEGMPPLVLKASKDNFSRSTGRTRNNGGSPALAIAHIANIRTIMAFDLTTVTNEIVGATLRLRMHNSLDAPLSFTVAPMVNTKNNIAWGEGAGNLGVSGQIAQSGDSCYSFSNFMELPWESASGATLINMADSGLWGAPVATLRSVAWKEGDWIEQKLNVVALLEKIRTSDMPLITLGLWGNDGNGFYFISSKETAWAPELVLTLAEPKS